MLVTKQWGSSSEAEIYADDVLRLPRAASCSASLFGTIVLKHSDD